MIREKLSPAKTAGKKIWKIEKEIRNCKRNNATNIKLKTMNTTVTVTKVTQTANKELGTKEKEIYYLIIENEKKEKEIINIGQKTYDKITKLTGGKIK